MSIRRDKRGMVNLTDMWRTAGSPPNKEPRQWAHLQSTRDLAEFLAQNVGKSHVLRSSPGRDGGTWACRNLAVWYAKYLSPEFHAWANQVIAERIEEDRNPELAYTRGRSRAIAGYRRQGKSDRWIQARLDGIPSRVHLTEKLQERGLSKSSEFAACTNALYVPLLGGTAKEVKLSRDLPAKSNLRDNMTAVELASVALGETLAEERIDGQDLYGARQCAGACSESGYAVANAVIEFRASPGTPPAIRRLPEKNH